MLSTAKTEMGSVLGQREVIARGEALEQGDSFDQDKALDQAIVFDQYIHDLLGKHTSCVTISIVGAGGKTSLIFKLAGILQADHRVLITTTTMMFTPKEEVNEILFQGNKSNQDLLNVLDEHFKDQIKHDINCKTKRETKCEANSKRTCDFPLTAIYKDTIRLEEIKVEKRSHTSLALEGIVEKAIGIEGSLVDALNLSGHFDVILVEADGSKRKPLKAYAEHEPVIPVETDIVFIVMGLSALNMPITRETVHRLPQFLDLIGKEEGEPLEVEDLYKLFQGKNGFLKSIPSHSKIIVLLNQSDCVDEGLNFSTISHRLLAIDPRLHGVFVMSLKKNTVVSAVLKE